MVKTQGIVPELVDLCHPFIYMALVRVAYMGQRYELIKLLKIGIVFAFVVLEVFVYI